MVDKNQVNVQRLYIQVKRFREERKEKSFSTLGKVVDILFPLRICLESSSRFASLPFKIIMK